MTTLSTVENCSIQLTSEYSWNGHGLQTGHRLAFLLWLSDFKTKISFEYLTKKKTGSFFFKSKNELVRPKMMFLAILAKI